ncbi:MAG TPA: VOC family protein [Steroidobacteraceae bacterium]|nr:VOC family protein [Steroidobacteraceae bacterium]
MKTVDLKLEVVVIPVADVDRAKRFYAEQLGWRLDADFAAGDEFRVVQLTPPGSPCSIHFGKGLTSAAPGLPGRVTGDETAYGSSTDLANAMRRAETAHGEHEKRTGQRDADWPSWYAAYMIAEQKGKPLPT